MRNTAPDREAHINGNIEYPLRDVADFGIPQPRDRPESYTTRTRRMRHFVSACGATISTAESASPTDTACNQTAPGAVRSFRRQNPKRSLRLRMYRRFSNDSPKDIQ